MTFNGFIRAIVPWRPERYLVVGSTAAIFQAIVAGKVDAGPSTADFLPLVEANGVNVMADCSQEMPYFLCSGRVTSDRMIRDKPAIVQAMINASLRSHRYGLDNKEAFVKYTVEKMAKEREAMEFLWEYDYKYRMVSADGEVDPRSVVYSQQINVMVGAQKGILPFEGTTNLEFQKKFLKKCGPYQWR